MIEYNNITTTTTTAPETTTFSNNHSPSFRYFQQTAELLKTDPFLLFVNAFNYNAYPHTAHDPRRLYRAHGIPGYGWMTTRKAAAEMLAGWVPLNQVSVPAPRSRR